ncbi:unnamed protein product [Aphanomyces euteiches]
MLHLRQTLRRLPASSRRSFARPLSSLDEPIIFKSPHGSIDLTPRTAWDIVKETSIAHADKPALICGVKHEQLTHGEFLHRVELLATGLAERGVGKGTLYHAITALGATMSPASPMFSATDVARQIEASNATFLVTHETTEDAARDAAILGRISPDNCFCIGTPKHFQPFSVLYGSSKRDLPPVSLDIMSDVNYLPFSSGTTGVPKGVKLTFWNMAINMLQMGHGEVFNSPAMLVLPYYHIYASTLMNTVLISGQPQVVLPKFDHEKFLECLERYQISKAHIVPPIASFLAKHPLVDKYDLSSMQYVISAAAPLGAGLEEAVKERLGITVKQCYGMTELSPIVNYSKDNDLKSASTGQLVPNTELRVVCPSSGKDLGPNEVGELWYRGPQVMQGYLNNEEATSSTTTQCGFLKTGDLGYIDDDGHIYVVDRLKELIKYKGYQVAPAELEDVILTHPKVLDVACIRGYNEEREEVPKACVVVRPNETLTSEELMEFVASRVAPYKKVRQVAFVPEIPKNPSGKILRRELQEQHK